MRYRDLGPVEVIDNAEARPLPGAKPTGVLALLLLSPSRAVTADTLITALWPDRPPARARATLQSNVWRLRKALACGGAGTPSGSSVIGKAASGYVLRAEPEQVDSFRFCALARWASMLSRQGRYGEAVVVADEAFALWRAPLFGPLCDASWAAARAAELDEARACLRETQWEALLLTGHAARVLDETAPTEAEEPLRERMWELRIRALSDCGHVDAALATYRRARQVFIDELGIEPGVGLRTIHTRILRGVPAGGPHPPAAHVPAGPRRRAALPAALSSFVGRGRDMAAVGALLAEHRLVTLVGAGGVGKTRLAVEVAKSTHAGQFGLARFVDLCSVPAAVGDRRTTTTRELAVEVADMIGVTCGGRSAVADPVDALRDTLALTPALIVLDNCEHLEPAVGELIAALLRDAQAIRVLATSRQPIRVPGEVTWPVQPLTDAAAIRLLTDRLAAVVPADRLSGAEAGALTTICRAVANLPLGVELAAARARTFTLTDVARSLRDEPRRDRVKAGPARHRSMSATVEWSHAQLDDAERTVFRRLAAFPAAFDLADVEAVCTFDTVSRRTVDAVLSSLVHRNLVSAGAAGDTTLPTAGRSWFRLLEPMRVRAESELAECGERERVRSLLSDRVIDRIRARPVFGDSDRDGWFDDMDLAWPSVRSAMPRLLDDPAEGIPAITRLDVYCALRRHTAQATAWMGAAVDAAAQARVAGTAGPDVVALARGAWAIAEAFRQRAEPPDAEDLELAADLCRIPLESSNALAATEQAVGLALSVWVADRYEHAASIAVMAGRRATAMRRERLAMAAAGIEMLCGVVTGRHDSETITARAQRFHLEAVRAAAPLAATTAALAAALASRAQGRYADAMHWSGEQVRQYLDMGGRDLCDAFEHRASLLVLTQRFEPAARMFGAASAARTRSGLHALRFAFSSAPLLATARERLGEHRFNHAFDEGQLAEPEEMLAEILGQRRAGT